MSEFGRELALDELPHTPLYRLKGSCGENVFEQTEVGGESAEVGALFATRELAEEFSGAAEEHGMEAFAGLEPEEIEDWATVEEYAVAGEDYILVISESGAGLFHATDVGHMAAERAREMPFPLYVLADVRGEAPLISVETEDGEVSVVALFTSPERARAFRELADHLDLPETLGTIEDADGLRRHALVARQAGADYAVMDPDSGHTDAIPVDELI